MEIFYVVQVYKALFVFDKDARKVMRLGCEGQWEEGSDEGKSFQNGVN